jgi:diguanylate cyclase (GGDEF)-like protein
MKVFLLMSPDQDSLRIVDRMSYEGYQVFQAHDQEQAYSIVGENQIQVAIIDVETSCQTFIENLRRIDTTNYIYIFAMIPEARELNRNEWIEITADEYLFKPVEPDELIARLVVVNRYSQTLTDIRSKQNYTEPIRDPITGTFSRTAILELINTEMSRCKRFKKPFILALLEIDHAAEIQTNFGLEIYNRAMSQVGLKIWATVRAYDLIGRWADDRFILLLPETVISGALIVANRLQKNISRVPLSLPENGQLELSASISFVQCGKNKYSTREEIIESVETLLAKLDRETSNKTVYSQDI